MQEKASINKEKDTIKNKVKSLMQNVDRNNVEQFVLGTKDLGNFLGSS